MNKKNKMLVSLLLVTVAVVSLLVVSRSSVPQKLFSSTLESISEKQTTTSTLTAASTAAMTAISLMPGDAATPVATQLANVTSYLVIVVCALLLEKFLVVGTWYLSFRLIVPLACVLMTIVLFTNNERCKKIIARSLVFALATILVVPISIGVADAIEAQHKEAFDAAISFNDKDAAKDKQSDDKSGESTLDTIKDKVVDIKDTVVDKVTAVGKFTQNIVGYFIESIAVLIITNCVIPILILMLILWLMKVIIGTDFGLTKKFKKGSGVITKKTQDVQKLLATASENSEE